MTTRFKKTGYDLKPHSYGVTVPSVKDDGRAWGIRVDFVMRGKPRQEFFDTPKTE